MSLHKNLLHWIVIEHIVCVCGSLIVKLVMKTHLQNLEFVNHLFPLKFAIWPFSLNWFLNGLQVTFFGPLAFQTRLIRVIHDKPNKTSSILKSLSWLDDGWFWRETFYDGSDSHFRHSLKTIEQNEETPLETLSLIKLHLWWIKFSDSHFRHPLRTRA